MRRASTGLLLLLTVAALGVLLAFGPAWASALGLDAWSVPVLLGSLDQETQRQDRLDGEDQVTWHRLTDKEEVVGQVITGRLTLREAAGRFRRLDAGASEQHLEAWRLVIEGTSDEERYRRTVITYVKARLQDWSEETSLVRGLNAQLAADVRQGDLSLPE